MDKERCNKCEKMMQSVEVGNLNDYLYLLCSQCKENNKVECSGDGCKYIMLLPYHPSQFIDSNFLCMACRTTKNYDDDVDTISI
jgi:phage FluMu protein Com